MLGPGEGEARPTGPHVATDLKLGLVNRGAVKALAISFISYIFT